MTISMTAMKVHAGDQIQLPSSVDHQGKTYELIPFESKKSKRLKGLICTRIDLSKIQNSIEKYLENPSHDFEHFYALVIVYRKCWSETGNRYFKLEKKRDLKNAPETVLNFHDFLLNTGNKYVAHPDLINYDQSALLLVMDEGKAIDIYPFRMTLEGLDADQYRVWLQLLAYLDTNLEHTAAEMKQSVLDEYNSSSHTSHASQKL